MNSSSLVIQPTIWLELVRSLCRRRKKELLSWHRFLVLQSPKLIIFSPSLYTSLSSLKCIISPAAWMWKPHLLRALDPGYNRCWFKWYSATENHELPPATESILSLHPQEDRSVGSETSGKPPPMNTEHWVACLRSLVACRTGNARVRCMQGRREWGQAEPWRPLCLFCHHTGPWWQNPTELNTTAPWISKSDPCQPVCSGPLTARREWTEIRKRNIMDKKDNHRLEPDSNQRT